MFKKTIVVETNDPKNPTLNLKLEGSVEKFADITPRHIRLAGPPESPLKAVVTISPAEKHPFKILRASAEKGEYIRFNLQETTRDNRPAYLLTVENTKDSIGRYFDTIHLKTDNPAQTEISIWVYGDIKEKKKETPG